MAFRMKPTLHLWERTFGYINLIGVLIQLVLPCSAPWYELIYGSTPANYGMKGSPGGLACIDALSTPRPIPPGLQIRHWYLGPFHCSTPATQHSKPYSYPTSSSKPHDIFGHTQGFSTCILPTITSSMSSVEHASPPLYLPDEFKGSAALAPPLGLNSSTSGRTRNKYNLYDLEDPRLKHNGYDNRGGVLLSVREFDAVSETSLEEEEVDITYRSPVPGNTTFPSSVHDGPPPPASARKKGFPMRRLSLI